MHLVHHQPLQRSITCPLTALLLPSHRNKIKSVTLNKQSANHPLSYWGDRSFSSMRAKQGDQSEHMFCQQKTGRSYMHPDIFVTLLLCCHSRNPLIMWTEYKDWQVWRRLHHAKLASWKIIVFHLFFSPLCWLLLSSFASWDGFNVSRQPDDHIHHCQTYGRHYITGGYAG